MFSGLETGFGLDVVLWLQAHSNPLFDAVAVALHYVGSNEFYALLALVTFSLINRRLGVLVLLVMLLCMLASSVVKEIFRAPRPYLVSDQVVELVVQRGYGMPSGHVIAVLAVMGTLAQWVRRRAAWLLVIGYTLLMGWARMVVGVHYPQDVVAGLIVGVLTLWLYTRVIGPRVERRIPSP